MIVYHGSRAKNLKRIFFKKENSAFINEMQSVEGEGIYLIEDITVALAYARESLYTIEIEDSLIFDGTKMETFHGMLQSAYDLTDNISYYIELEHLFDILEDTLKLIIEGQYSCSEWIRQVFLIIGSDESLYLIEEETNFITNLEKLFSKYKVVKSGHLNWGSLVVSYDETGDSLEIIKEEPVENCEFCPEMKIVGQKCLSCGK